MKLPQRKTLIFLTLLLVALVALTHLLKSNPKENLQLSNEDQKTESVALSKVLEPVTTIRDEATEADKVAVTLLPENQEVLEEIRNNPHETPASLVEFASQIGKKMELAIKDPRAAKELVKELETCAEKAKQDSAKMTLEVFCIEQATKLSNRHRELQETVENLVRNSSPKANQILKLVQKVKKN
jgi:hypothetical protein